MSGIHKNANYERIALPDQYLFVPSLQFPECNVHHPLWDKSEINNELFFKFNSLLSIHPINFCIESIYCFQPHLLFLQTRPLASTIVDRKYLKKNMKMNDQSISIMN